MNIEKGIALLRALPKNARIASIAIAAFAVAGATLFALVSHAPRAGLFANPLHAEQLNEVEEELAAWSVPFTPTADNVVVDANARGSLLLRLSLAGVPHAHVATTSETLANVGVLTPETVVEAQTRSGLAGDIEIGLRSVNGVDDARVIIAPAKAAEFADESTREASASVRLQLHAGSTLGRDAIDGIRHFVAASVPGLDAARVTILDDRGVALGDGSSAGDDGDALERSLQTALDAALGPAVAIVRVHAQYANDSVERREARRQPVLQALIERAEVSETYAGDGKHYEKHDVRDDAGSDTRETVTQTRPGALAHLSTAVFVDASRNVDVASVRALSAATVGFDPRRGDSLVVEAVDFHHELRPQRDGWFLLYGAFVPAIPAIALAGALVLFARLALPVFAPLVKTFAQRTSVERTTRAVAGYAPAHVRGALANEPPHAAAAIISALPAATAAAVLELYPQPEREAIVRRMQRAHSSLVPDVEEILGRHA